VTGGNSGDRRSSMLKTQYKQRQRGVPCVGRTEYTENRESWKEQFNYHSGRILQDKTNVKLVYLIFSSQKEAIKICLRQNYEVSLHSNFSSCLPFSP
jgi:hypothetical protein